MFRTHRFHRADGRPAVIIDLDDTLWPMMPHFVAETDGALSLDDIDRWDVPAEVLGRGRASELFRRTFRRQHADLIAPLPGASDALEAIRATGHQAIIVTDRPPHTAPGLIRWVRHHDLEVDGVWVGRGCKIQTARRLGARAIVDDRPSTLSKAHAAGLITATLRYPYNRDARKELPDVIHAPSWRTLSPKLVDALVGGEADS